MQGVKGTHDPGQHGTYVNCRPRIVQAGGIVRFGHRKYQSDRLLAYVGQEVMVRDVSIWGEDYVSVALCEYLYRPRNGRMATVRVGFPWLADAQLIAVNLPAIAY